MEWQLIGTDEWVYGRKVRGIVRVALACVYQASSGRYVCEVKCGNNIKGSNWEKLHEAIEAAEKEMGIESESPVPCPNCQANLLDVGTRTVGACTFCNRCAAEVTEAIKTIPSKKG